MSKLIISYPGGVARVNVTKNNISIKDSYKIKKTSDMKNIIEQL